MTTETLSPVLPTRVEQDVERILKHLCDHEMTMATAESCTGGLLASLFTDVEGGSRAFSAGLVTYATETKVKLLGLDAPRLEEEGAVSEWTARAMADGAIIATGANLAIAVTGFAGPAGEGDEAGLVHFASKARGGKSVHRECHFGDIGRGPTRIKCIETAVDMLLDATGLSRLKKN